MIAVSKPSVEHWDDLIRDQKKEEWVEHKKMVIDRLGNMNVTVSIGDMLLQLLKLICRLVWY
jgi:hypothetical protein